MQYEPGIEATIAAPNSAWLIDSRMMNQSEQFRLGSVAQFRILHFEYLKRYHDENEAGRKMPPFDVLVDEVNCLLDRIRIDVKATPFRVLKKDGDDVVPFEQLSSGESELLSLAFELLAFESKCVLGRSNLLLIDEPDVHIHPDLQVRLAGLLGRIAGRQDLHIVVATHSTAMLAALSGFATNVAFMRKGDTDLSFRPCSDILRDLLPIFGAHPLSRVFNDRPLLLVEGDDDVRIWSQAARTSGGRIKVHPCPAGSIDRMNQYEKEAARILTAVYDSPRAFSIRDRDGVNEEIDDMPPLRRFRLACRTAENLLLTDDVLCGEGTTWETLKLRVREWCGKNLCHAHFDSMQAFAATFDRRGSDLKTIRNDICSIIGSSTPWEVMVGRAIARSIAVHSNSENSIHSYLGSGIVREVLCVE